MPVQEVDAATALAGQLDLFSLAALKSIVSTLRLPVRGTDRSEYIAALSQFVGTSRHREVLEERLSKRDWAILNLLPLRVVPFRLRTLLVALKDQGLGPDFALDAVSRLLAHGCLLSATQFYGDQRIGIAPRDLRQLGLDIWFGLTPGIVGWADAHEPGDHQLPTVDPPSSIVESRLSELQRTVYIILAEASRKPVRLTVRGVPYKAELTRLASALAAGASTGGRSGKRASEVSILPVAWFALAALVGSRLLEQRDQSLVPTGDASAFMAAPTAQQVRRLLNGWRLGPFDDLVRVPSLVLYAYDGDSTPSTPWLTSGGYDGDTRHERVARSRLLISEALRVATANARDAWYSIEDLASLVYRHNPEMLFEWYNTYELLHGVQRTAPGWPAGGPSPYFGVYRSTDNENGPAKPTLYHDQDWAEVEGAFVRQVLAESLRWLDLVEVGPDLKHPDRFRLTPLGRHVLGDEPLEADSAEPSGRAVVQPNFEVVVVDALANTGLLAQLDAFATRRSLDRAATYRLTQADLVRGLDTGWTGARVIETLEAMNGGPLPQNVQYTLQEWIALYERLTVREQATLLEADDERQLDQWLADASMSRLLGKRLSPTMVLVPASNADQVAQVISHRAKKIRLINYSQKPTGLLEIRNPDLIEIKTAKIEPYLSYRLGAFATPIEQDKQRTLYQMTPAGVARAAEAGWKGKRLAEFLATAFGQPLPEDFLVRLLGWSSEVPAVQYEPIVLLRLRTDLVDWSMLRAIPSIARRIRAAPTPELALVALDDVDELRKELQERGIGTHQETIEASAIEQVVEIDPIEAALASALKERFGSLSGGTRLPGNVTPLFGRPKKGNPVR